MEFVLKIYEHNEFELADEHVQCSARPVGFERMFYFVSILSAQSNR